MRYLFLVLLAGCSVAPIVEKELPKVDPVIVSPVPSVDRIKIKCSESCTKEESDELPSLSMLVDSVEKSKCFSDHFTSQKKIDLPNGYSALNIVEKLSTSKVSAELRPYYKRFTKVVGIDKGNGKVYVNRKFYSYFTKCEKASLLAHELSHSLGWSHYGNSSAGNEQTVPYLVNSGFDLCCK